MERGPSACWLPARQVQGGRKAIANTSGWALYTEPKGVDSKRGGQEAKGGSEKRRRSTCSPCVPGAVLGLSDPARRSTGTWHLARAAAHPDGHKRELEVVTARTFLQGLSRLQLLGFQVGVGGGVGRCGKDRGEGTVVATSALEAHFARKGGPVRPPPSAQARHFSNRAGGAGDNGLKKPRACQALEWGAGQKLPPD